MRATEQQVRTNQKILGGLSDLRQGTCVSIDWPTGMAVVNIPGSTVSIPMAGTAPIPNALCWVGFMGNQPICLGAVARPPLATVAGPAVAGIVSVTGDDGVIYQVAYDTLLTPASADRVLIDWTSGGTILCIPSADPNTGLPVNTPGEIPSGGSQTRTFNPIDSGTQNGSGDGSGGFWTSQVYCGSTTVGGYFYGGQIAGSIPDDAVIDSVVLHLNAERATGDAPTIGLHTLTTKAGNLVVTSAVTVALGSGDRVLPNSFGDALKTGAAAGVGTHHGGYSIYSPAGVGNSGALTITWH